MNPGIATNFLFAYIPAGQNYPYVRTKYEQDCSQSIPSA